MKCILIDWINYLYYYTKRNRYNYNAAHNLITQKDIFFIENKEFINTEKREKTRSHNVKRVDVNSDMVMMIIINEIIATAC